MAAITISAPEVIEQLEKSRGNIAHAARQLRTSRNTLHNYINAHPTVKAALEDIRESMLDTAETMLQQRMMTDNTLLIFYLKTQGYRRGYGVDRLQHEISGPDGGAIRIVMDV